MSGQKSDPTTRPLLCPWKWLGRWLRAEGGRQKCGSCIPARERYEFLPAIGSRHNTLLEGPLLLPLGYKYMVDEYAVNRDPNSTMPVFQALRWGISSWNKDVTSATVVNCWLQSWLLGPDYRSLTEAQAKEQEKAQSAGVVAQVWLLFKNIKIYTDSFYRLKTP